MWTRKGDLYTLIQDRKKEFGQIPEQTCPDIDNIIKELEKLREDNSKLRDLGRDWYNFCEELSCQSDKIINELEDEISELEREKSELEYEIKSLKED